MMTIKQGEIEKIKKLLKKGFDAELIAFELEYTLEEVKQIKNQMGKDEKSRTYSYEEIVKQRNMEKIPKIKKLRQKYRALYFNINETKTIESKEVTQEQIEKVNQNIRTIKTNIEEMKNLSKYDKRKKAKNIVLRIKELEEYLITIEQGEMLISLMSLKDLDNLRLNREDTIDRNVDNARKRINRKFIEAVDNAQKYTYDLDELKKLSKKLSSEKRSMNPMYFDTVKARINSKIDKINQENAIKNIKNNIPENIKKIIEELAIGQLNISKAKGIIEQEARRKVDNKPKTKFSLTKEQEERQIKSRILIILRDRYDEFHITNPEKTILQLHELCDCNLERAIEIVFQNLVSSKKYEEADKICEKFDTGNLSLEMRNLKKKIKNARISDMVLNLINNTFSPEEEMVYFELIEKAIKNEKLKIETIDLGKSQNGMKNISLADIWIDTNQKNVIR